MDGENCCKNKKIISVFVGIVSVFFIVLIASTAVGTINKIREGKYIGGGVNTIAVSGTGEVYTKPDLAMIDFSVITEDKTVADALGANTKSMNKVIGFLKDQKIDEKDLKTTYFYISPRYEYYDEYGNKVSYDTGKRVLVGYEVTQTVEVKIRDLTKVGEIIQGAADSGANQVGTLYFTVENKDEFERQAREEAIANAKIKAQQLAAQLGVRLVRITSFSENWYPTYYNYAYEKAAPAGSGGGAPQIETGENKVESTVSITYEIR